MGRLCSSIKASDNHEFYNSLLQKFVPSWKLDILEAVFIPESGGGESSLNSFRKVKIDGNWYFEKVYFNSCDDVKKVIWFNHNLRDRLMEFGINTPKLYSNFAGESFTIVYFDFLDLIRIQNAIELENSLIEIVKKLYQISAGKSFIQTKNLGIEKFKNFRDHLEYKKNIDGASKRILKDDILTEDFETKAGESKLIISHGDLHEKNIYKDFVLIDWDNFGYYPIGFDPAFLSFRLLTSGRVNDYSSGWLENNFKEIIGDKDWADFERNFYYFFFVFTAKYFGNEQFMSTYSHVIEKLKFYNN